MTPPVRSRTRTRFALAVLAALVASGLARAQLAHEADLKAAYVFNFLSLTTWLEDPGPVLRVCVAGASGPAALRTLGGKLVRERTVSVIAAPSPERIAGCHALYVPRTESMTLAPWLAAAERLPMLTISEAATPAGAILNLRLSGDQVVFDVDTRAAAHARLVLSSQLLKLAATRQ